MWDPGSKRSLEILVDHRASEPVQEQGEEERGEGQKVQRQRCLSVTQSEDLQRQLQFEYTLVSPQDVMHLN